jgi:erythromycin esterase-like protein
MTTLEMIAERVRDLPVDKQREVLDFVEFLRARVAPRRSLSDVVGLCKGFDVSSEDIEQAQRDLWSGFPREDI